MLRECAQPLVTAVPGGKLSSIAATGGEHGHRGWCKLAHQSKRQPVGAEWVSSTGNPVPNWSLTGHGGPDEVAQYGKHGQAAVLGLLDLQLGETVRVVSQTQRVKRFTRQQIKTLTGRARLVCTVGLNGTHQQHLAGQDGKDGLGVDQGRVAKAIPTPLLEHASTNLGPDRLAGLETRVLGQDLRGQAAQISQHSPTGVDQLSLTVPLKGGWVSTRISGVAGYSRVRSAKVGHSETGPNHLLQ